MLHSLLELPKEFVVAALSFSASAALVESSFRPNAFEPRSARIRVSSKQDVARPASMIETVFLHQCPCDVSARKPRLHQLRLLWQRFQWRTYSQDASDLRTSGASSVALQQETCSRVWHSFDEMLLHLHELDFTFALTRPCPRRSAGDVLILQSVRKVPAKLSDVRHQSFRFSPPLVAASAAVLVVNGELVRDLSSLKLGDVPPAGYAAESSQALRRFVVHPNEFEPNSSRLPLCMNLLAAKELTLFLHR